MEKWNKENIQNFEANFRRQNSSYIEKSHALMETLFLVTELCFSSYIQTVIYPFLSSFSSAVSNSETARCDVEGPCTCVH